MYCKYKYIVKISVSQLAKLAWVPKAVAVASLTLLNSNKGSSAPPAQTPVTPNSLGPCRATPTFLQLKWESCGQILHTKQGIYDLQFQVEKYLHIAQFWSIKYMRMG